MPSWNSGGVAGRYTSSFSAAVDGFITWDFFGLLTGQGSDPATGADTWPGSAPAVGRPAAGSRYA